MTRSKLLVGSLFTAVRGVVPVPATIRTRSSPIRPTTACKNPAAATAPRGCRRSSPIRAQGADRSRGRRLHGGAGRDVLEARAPIAVHVHRIHARTAAAARVTVGADQQPDQRAQRRVRVGRAGASRSRAPTTRTTRAGTRRPTARPPRRTMKTALRIGGADGSQPLHEQHGRRPARLGDVPVGLRAQPEDGRRRRPVLVAARRQRGAVQPRRHRDARDRPLDGPLSHVPGRLLEDATTASATRRPRRAPRSAARRAATRAPAASTRASTRSRTSWTTRTTPA